MKRLIAAILVLLCFASVFVSCAKADDGDKTVNIEELVKGFTTTYSLTDGTLYEKNTHPLDEMQIFDLYYKDGSAADFSVVEEYVLYLDNSSYEADTEIGVFRLAPGADTQSFLSYLRARRDSLLAENERYPFDTAALEQAKFGTSGRYVYYVILRDHSADVESAIKTALK